MTGSRDAVGKLPRQEPQLPEGTHVYRWTGEFADAQLEASFMRASWDEIRSRLKTVLIAVYIFVAWSAFDFLMLGPGWAFFALFAGRLSALVAILLALKVYRTPDQATGFALCGIIVQALVCVVSPVSLMLGEAELAAALLATVVILFAFYVGLPTRLTANLVLSTILCGGFLAILPSLADVGLFTFLQILALFLVVNAVGAEMSGAA